MGEMGGGENPPELVLPGLGRSTCAPASCNHNCRTEKPVLRESGFSKTHEFCIDSIPTVLFTVELINF